MFKKIYLALGVCTLFGMILGPVVLTIGPIIEGRLFPVVDQATVKVSAPDGVYAIRITGSSRKIRECEFKGIEWSFAPPYGPAVDAPVEFLEGTKSRANGWFDFGEWIVQLNERQLQHSISYAYHSCHPLWKTRTLFYKGEGVKND